MRRKLSRDVRVSLLCLLDHATRDTRAASAKRLGMVGMVVAAGVDHQREPFNLVYFLYTRREHRLIGLAITRDVQGR